MIYSSSCQSDGPSTELPRLNSRRRPLQRGRYRVSYIYIYMYSWYHYYIPLWRAGDRSFYSFLVPVSVRSRFDPFFHLSSFSSFFFHKYHRLTNDERKNRKKNRALHTHSTERFLCRVMAKNLIRCKIRDFSSNFTYFFLK